MNKDQMNPESLMMTHGYKPELSEGAVKCPVFQTSTFVFKTAEEGKAFFEIAYGLRDKEPKEELLNEEEVFFDGSYSYDSHESCEDIKNPQTQKNCFDTYL